jgi:hypothetical protein
MRCEEIISRRACTDSAPRTVVFAPGQSTAVAAPVIDGYPTACWNWARKFQCIETDPTYNCDSDNPFDTVKRDCTLGASQIQSATVVNGISYITSADYTYRCAFGAWTTNDKLPANKECIGLDTKTSSSNFITGVDGVATATTETRDEKSVCYSAPTTTCSNTCFADVLNPATNRTEKKEVPCTETLTSCTTSSNQCAGTVTRNPDGSLNTSTAIGPDGRCVESREEQMCQAGKIPKCLTGDNCQLSSTSPASVQDNGFALGQKQEYICSNETTSCTEYANVSNCVHVGAWGWDKMAIKTQVGEGLAEVNQAMAQLEGVEKGLAKEDPYIFSGQDLRCHFAVGNFLNTFIAIVAVAAIAMATGGAGLVALQGALGVTAGEAAAITIGAAAINDAPNSKAIGSNCCKEYVFEGSDAWYKLGTCTADEIKLSVAKRKGLAEYLGEYCSKKSGFPVKQCVERTRSYCVFDDMLAYSVNQQGRAQLDALAMADPTTTKATPAQTFSLFTPPVAGAPKYTGYLDTGKWLKLVQETNSQVWAWQYPAYCLTPAAQQAAHDIWMAELSAVTDTKGKKPEDMTKDEAVALLNKTRAVAAFQECPSTPGTMSFLTCSKQDDSCDTSKLPEGPSGVEVDISGSAVSASDVNWRVQQAASFYKPGDYGVTATMPTNTSFAAVTKSINEFISAVGSCHSTDGACHYYFAITDKKATNGLGAKKRATENAQFPLYHALPNSAWPAVTYVSKDGVLDTAAYAADPNRGRGDPLAVSTQRFIFHPNYVTRQVQGQIHSAVLLEYANQKATGPGATPEDAYAPLMVPTSLPPGTPGWYPYGDAKQHGKYFYLSGGCSANSRWCNYEIMVDLDIARHPWGTAQAPRCWGFTLEQLAALDFDKMDLSRYINSLGLDQATASMSTEAATAMSKQVTQSAQTFYNNFKSGEAVNKPGAGTMALVTNTDVLPLMSGGNFRAYTLELGVPSNWPAYFPNQPNNNPVTDVRVDWGDGKTQTLTLASGGQAYLGEHDYGDLKTGRYKVTVTLNTAGNGPQMLTTHVALTPDAGGELPKTTLDFNDPGSNGKAMGEYVPSDTPGGFNQAPANLETIAPAVPDNFQRQGDAITPPTPPGGK